MPSGSADGVIGWLDTRTPTCRLTSRTLVKCTATDPQEEPSDYDLRSFNVRRRLHPAFIGGNNNGNMERHVRRHSRPCFAHIMHIHSLLSPCHLIKIPVKTVRYTAAKYARKLEAQQHLNSARRQAKEHWHPDRCGFFVRVSQDFGPCAGAGAAAWRICTCCHCITWRDVPSKLERVCPSQYRLHLESATSTRSRTADWCHRIFQEPRMPFGEHAFQAGKAQCHNPFGC